MLRLAKRAHLQNLLLLRRISQRRIIELMRIRKTASKLLGLAPPPPSSSSTPCTAARSSPHWPPSASTPAAADDVLFCQLNCSPWDVLTDLDDLILLQRDDEEDVKLEDEELHDGRSFIVPGRDSIKVDEPSGEGKKKAAKLKKTTATRRKKEEESVHGVKSSRVVVGVVTCKKTDGKSWHCKRPAQPSHTLCHHHLDQLRSYSNSASAAADLAAAAGDGTGRCRRKKTDAAAANGGGSGGSGGVDANAYYYYSGFGPWRGKTRGCGGDGCASNIAASAAAAREEEDDDDDAPVAGGDEESESLEEEDGSAHGEGGGEYLVMRDDENRRKFRKRGRKAVKARSLKSLL